MQVQQADLPKDLAANQTTTPHAYSLRLGPVSLLRCTLPLRMVGLAPSTHEEHELEGLSQHGPRLPVTVTMPVPPVRMLASSVLLICMEPWAGLSQHSLRCRCSKGLGTKS